MAKFLCLSDVSCFRLTYGCWTDTLSAVHFENTTMQKEYSSRDRVMTRRQIRTRALFPTIITALYTPTLTADPEVQIASLA